MTQPLKLAVAASPVLFLAVFLFPPTAGASVTLSLGAGSAVSTVDRAATFDPITSPGINLSNYQEGLLSISVPDTSFVGFNAFNDGTSSQFHYGSGGNSSFVTIRGTDLAVMTGLEFKIGSGFLSLNNFFMAWQTYLDGTLTGSGSSVFLTKGSIVGWSDLAGFDELRVGASPTSSYNLGQSQYIALDNVRVQLLDTSNATVPEPLSLLVWVGLASVAGLVKYRRSR